MFQVGAPHMKCPTCGHDGEDGEIERILALSDEQVMLEALEELGSREAVKVRTDQMRALIEKALNSCGYWKH